MNRHMILICVASSVITVIVLGLVASIAFAGGFVDRSGVSTARAKLDSGEITMGSHLHEKIDLPADGKPLVHLSRTRADGEEFEYLLFQNEYEAVHLYAKEGIVFGAFFVGHRDYAATERWYFCDEDLFLQHIELSIEQ